MTDENEEEIINDIEDEDDDDDLTIKDDDDKEKSKDKEIQVISHVDTDGITSAAIIIQALKKLDKNFSVKIIKSLEEQFIHDLPKEKITLFSCECGRDDCEDCSYDY